MKPTNTEPRALIAILWIATIYFYFLIFAQFAFLELLKVQQTNELAIKLVMGAMGGGGIIGSLITPYLLKHIKVSQLMRVSALCCGVVSFCSLFSGALFLFIPIAFLMGVSLGILTVSLAGHVTRIFGRLNVALGVGIGTGVAYGFCNLPLIFQAEASIQAVMASVVMFVVSLLPFKLSDEKYSDSADLKIFKKTFFSGLLVLTILVWLDSAAFFIIQQTPDLKDMTWGSGLLGRNAVVHLSIAVLSGYLLSKRYFHLVTILALALLSLAALMLDYPELRLQAGMLYPAGVSLYSVALIVFPSWYLGGSTEMGIKRAAILFAIAGWFGSAMGIGMGQNLARIPIAFVLFSIVVVFTPLLLKILKKKELIVAGVVSGVCYFSSEIFASNKEDREAGFVDQERMIEKGKRVYLQEGCIHCHSRYVRPSSKDEEMWGSYLSKDTLRSESPPLIGYRRQGPDLLHVGMRRSSDWLKQHFIDPKAFNKESTMPSYAHLFENDSLEGDALIAFLKKPEKDLVNTHLQKREEWKPVGNSSDTNNGQRLFQEHCMMCHGDSSNYPGSLAQHFKRLPTNLKDGSFAFSAGLTNSIESRHRIARIIKYGIYGTDMPGHETLSDDNVLDLVSYLHALRTKELK